MVKGEVRRPEFLGADLAAIGSEHRPLAAIRTADWHGFGAGAHAPHQLPVEL